LATPARPWKVASVVELLVLGIREQGGESREKPSRMGRDRTLWRHREADPDLFETVLPFLHHDHDR
jgi:hypothetical protein